MRFITWSTGLGLIATFSLAGCASFSTIQKPERVPASDMANVSEPDCREVLEKLEVGTSCRMTLGYDFGLMKQLIEGNSYSFYSLMRNKFTIDSVKVSILPPSDAESNPRVRYLFSLKRNLVNPKRPLATEGLLAIESHTDKNSKTTFQSTGVLIEDLETERQFQCRDEGWKISALGMAEESYPPIADCFNSEGEVKHVRLLVRKNR